MAVNKAHDEFHAVDLSSGWEVPLDILRASSKRFYRAPWMKMERAAAGPGSCGLTPVSTRRSPSCTIIGKKFIRLGDLTVGNNENGDGGEAFEPNTYACRPPGAYHGPFKSNGGCMLLKFITTTRLDVNDTHSVKLRCVLPGGVIAFLSAYATSPDMRDGLFGSQRRTVVSDRAAARKRSIFAPAKIIRTHVSMVSGVSANTAPAAAASAGCSVSIVTTRFGPGNQAR